MKATVAALTKGDADALVKLGDPAALAKFVECDKQDGESRSEPEIRTNWVAFGPDDLPMIRAFVERRARIAGLDWIRTADLMLAADEIVSNSLRHRGGAGELRMWSETDELICEVRDAGRITGPLVGRVRPTTDEERGFGLWLSNQICDLMQIRTFDSGSIVRLHVRRRRAGLPRPPEPTA